LGQSDWQLQFAETFQEVQTVCAHLADDKLWAEVLNLGG